MNMFDDISKRKVDFPKFSTLFSNVSKYKLNFYQVFSLCLFTLFFFLGIILGNLFSTCEAASYYFSEACIVSQFNFSLMIAIWFVGILISVVFFSVGHIVSLLSSINEKLTKNHV